MIKKFVAKKLGKRAAKNLAIFAAKKEAQVIVGALLTIGTQKVLRKAAKKYPSLRFLKPRTAI